MAQLSPSTPQRGRFAKPRLLAVFAGVLALMALFAACGSADAPTPTPTHTPTPSPTPTPTPVPDAIVNLSADALYADLAVLLPQAAVNCLVDALGQAAYDGLLTQQVFGNDINFSADLPVDCFTEEVVISVFIATLSQAGDPLSAETETCIRNTFEGLGVGQLAALASGDLGSGGLTDIFGIGIGLLLCLSDDEAEQITAGGLFGDVGGFEAVSLGDIRCIFETVDLNEIMGLVSALEGGGSLDLGASLGLLTAMNDCGLSLDALSGAGGDAMDDGSMMDNTPQLLPGALDGVVDLTAIDLRNIEGITPELQAQITCVVDAIGEDNLTGMLDGSYTPTLADFGAIGACEIDLAQLGDLSAILGG